MADKHTLQFERIVRKPLHQQVADTIQDMIAVHGLKPGTQLPTERELAKQLDVNRTTIHAAVGLLQQRGLVEMRVGSGTYVIDMPQSVVADSIQRYFTFGNCSYEDLFSLRSVLEPGMAGLAAECGTEEELRVLKDSVEAMEDALERDDDQAFDTHEMAFHEGIAAATHNELMMAISGGLRTLVINWLADRSAGYRGRALVRVHAEVCNAILRRDAEAARQAMQKHMEFRASSNGRCGEE